MIAQPRRTSPVIPALSRDRTPPRQWPALMRTQRSRLKAGTTVGG
jgi:hypothetical protein